VLAPEEDAVEVDGLHLAPLVQGERLHVLGDADARVVHHHVQPAEVESTASTTEAHCSSRVTSWRKKRAASPSSWARAMPAASLMS